MHSIDSMPNATIRYALYLAPRRSEQLRQQLCRFSRLAACSFFPCEVRPLYLRRLRFSSQVRPGGLPPVERSGACCCRPNCEEQAMCCVFKKRNVRTSSAGSTICTQVQPPHAPLVLRVSCHHPTITVGAARRAISGAPQYPDLGGLSESIYAYVARSVMAFFCLPLFAHQ